MSTTISYSETEPTIQDVLIAMKDGFGSLEARMDMLNGGLESKIEILEDRMETGFHEVHRRLGNLENVVEDMRETLEATVWAVDRDAVTLVDHERRILRLEEV